MFFVSLEMFVVQIRKPKVETRKNSENRGLKTRRINRKEHKDFTASGQ
jgi:hypothetical protein